MSVINRKPFIETVLGTLTAGQLKTLKNLINGQGAEPVFRSLVPQSPSLLTVSDKGIKRVKLEVSRSREQNLYGGYLIYTDNVCVLIAYSSEENQELELINIEKANGLWKYSFLNYEFSITELRFEIDDVIEEVAGEVTQADLDELRLTPITWSELKALRDTSGLEPGVQYRITDYTCTTITTNTSSAGHVFDIIVTADDVNKLNEKARAIQHSGDTYFANNKLTAWEIWYCLDNDTNRFDWADSTNGKGVIYRMIDEFNNDVPYDFKNILFSKTDLYTNAYTFSYTENSTIKDASILGLNKKCYSNVIKEYISSNKQQLNFNAFYSTSKGFACYSNTFGNDCNSNTFGNNCNLNAFGNGCSYNTFGTYCNYNTFGNGCSYNTFGNNCIYNTFGIYCYHNTFGTYCCYNTFGTYSNYNTFGNNCIYNTFGNGCSYNTFGDSSSAINYCRYNIVDDGCQYLYINSSDTSESNSNQLQNIHIHLGVIGASSNNRRTITVPDRALTYSTDYYAPNSQEVILND